MSTSSVTSTRRADEDARQQQRAEQPAAEAVAARGGGIAPRAARRGRGDLGDRGAHSYTCRYLRTKRIEIAFMISVRTNSVVPTAKIVS